MFSWLLVNVVLSVLALTFVTLNASAPHRLRFVVSFVALLSWLMPWHLVPEFLPRWYSLDLWQMESQLRVNTAEYSLKPIMIMSTGLPLVAGNFLAFTLVQLGFIALCVTGLLLFFYHLCRHQIRLSQLRRYGQDGAFVLQLRGLTSPVPVIIQSEIAGAFSSGLLKPMIWIHRELAVSTQLATLLRHELTHISQHDNWYLLFITLIEKLFWWNPLVWLLGRQARELQELSCDVLCQRASADYPLHLAELMIDNARINPVQGGLLLSANIFSPTNLNIKRIKLLQRSYAMKPRHLFSTLVAAMGAFATIGLVTAQPEAGQQIFIHTQTAQLSEGEAGDVVFITRDPSQPLTEEEAAAFETRRIFVQATPGAALPSADFVRVPGAPPDTKMMGWVAGTPVAMDQYLVANKNGGETEVSFNFTDTPLAMVLVPLAHMVTNADMPAFGVAAVRAIPGSAAGQIRGARSGASASVAGEAEVVDFYVHAAEVFNTPIYRTMPAPVAGSWTMPFSSQLVMEDEADKEKLVSVKAVNVSIEAALEIIGAEANCNIFLEDDMIVVNSCAN